MAKCKSTAPKSGRRCQLVAGHPGPHQYVGVGWDDVLPNGRIPGPGRRTGLPVLSDHVKVIQQLLLDYLGHASVYTDGAELVSDLLDDLQVLDPNGYDPGASGLRHGVAGMTGIQCVERSPLYQELIAKVRVAEAVGDSRRSS